MMVFVDTSAFVAVAMTHDGRHAEAVTLWRRLEKERAALLTTDWVFGETVSFVRRREGYGAARKVGEALWASRVLQRVTPSAGQVERAWEAFLDYAFDGLSLEDAVSFVVARAHRARRVFTFDEHFAEAGFEIIE
jgi:predicted nucleic acid-binding protein